MKHPWSFVLILAAMGCSKPAPVVPPPVIPKDHVLVVSGPTDPDATTEFTTTESGLKYRILRKSDGKKPTATNVVRVHYRGRLDDGTIIDSTYGKFGHSVFIPLEQLEQAFKGLSEGIQLVGEGGMIELEIPPGLAYGETGKSPVPPNATLHFIVEVLEVK